MAAATWSRQKNLPKGFQLYCSKDWLQFYSQMGKPKKSYFSNEQLTPGALAARWLPEAELDRLIDGEDIDEAGRYMTVTARLALLSQITMTRMFRAQTRRHGSPVFLENHGPSIEWLARTKEIWAALPKDDSKIFKRSAETEKPALRHLAEKLAPLLQWARISKPLDLSSTNWMQADNDNYSDGEEPAPKPASNRERRIRPGSSDKELKSWIAAYEKGRLRISNGAQRESCYVKKNDKAVSGTVCMPAGAILYQPDAFRELLGPEPNNDDVDMTRAWAARVYSRPRTMDGKPVDAPAMEVSEREIDGRPFMVPRSFKPAGRIRRKVLITPEEQKALLSGQLPPITYCPPGLPNGSADLRGIFTGAEIMSTKGKPGVERWQDMSDELSRRTEFDRWAKALGPKMEKVMHLGLIAANFREIGEAFGKEGKNAERYGKRLLIAANNNSKKILAA